jgi:outer membrane protein OmpA-like peptidoglycan-associated protein/co-chaperonin GroES (HSP10)
MCQPSKWWWGLLPLALIWAFANWQNTGPIAQDLKTRAEAAATAIAGATPGIAPLAATVAGRDVSVTGPVRATAVQGPAFAAVDAASGVRRVDGALTQAQPLRPYLWSAERQGARVLLTGAVPDNTTKAATAAAAARAFPGAVVEDQQRLAFGAPFGFTAAATSLLPELGRLSQGKVTLSDLNLCLEGAAATSEQFANLQGRIAETPPGFTRQACAITPPSVSPYLWSAAKAASGAITLSGFYPSDAVRQEINQAARLSAPGATVTDQMQPALGAPAGFAAMAAFGLGQLGRLQEGAASLSDATYSITGRGPAAFDACDALARGAGAGLPQGFALGAAQIACPSPPPPPPVPLVFQAQKSPAGITLSGLTPSEEARQAVVAAAQRATSGSVTDRLTVTPNLADAASFGSATAFALGQLAGLTTGQADIAGSALTLTGAAPSAAAKTAADSALAAALPAGLRLARAEIAAPPPPPPPPPVALSWSAAKNANGIVLSGMTPSDEARAQVVAAARAATAGAVTDAMTVTPNIAASPAYAPATAFALARLAELSSGTASLNGASLVVTGNAANVAAKAAVDGALATLPEGLRLGRADIVAPAPPPPPPPPPAPPPPVVVPDFVIAAPAPPPPPTAVLFTATKTPQGITLAGLAPSEAERAAVVAAARQATSGRVTDTLTVRDNLVSPPEYGPATRFALAQLAPLTSGEARLEGPALSVTGAAPTAVAKSGVDGALGAPLPAGMQLATAQITAPPPPPPPPPIALRWSAVKDPSGIVLSGLAPSEAAKAAAVVAARASTTGAVTDQVTVERNLAATPPYGPAVDFALLQLGRLTTGRAELVGPQLNLTGVAPTPVAKQTVDLALNRALPAGVSRGQVDVAVRPYVLEGTFSRQGLVLQGFIPSEAGRAELLRIAEANGFSGRVRDELVVVPGEPVGFAAAAANSLDKALRLDLGSVRVDGNTVAITGMTCRDVIRQEVDTGARSGLPTGFTGSGQISLRQTGCTNCQLELDNATAGRAILFQQGRDLVANDPQTTGIITEVARVLEACPTARIAVEGHTNLDGERRGFPNRQLSENRARAVITALAQRGIAAERMTPRGFGPDRPLKPHATEEGRVQNRRVQFTILNP